MGARRRHTDIRALLSALCTGADAERCAATTAPDRTVPVAREWLRGWGPARAPKTGLMLTCACVDGCCEVCN
jgi:hypothetical protein